MTSNVDLNLITSWRKSSRSAANGNCVEAACLHGAAWRKSRRSSTNGSCVEVAIPRDAVVAVRDSKLPTDGDFPHLLVDVATWSGLVAGIKGGSIR
jgi:hypothetical protein